MTRLAPIITLLLAALVAPVCAQDLTINTDRPGFYESTATAPVGRLQLESGATFIHDDDGPDVDLWTLPQATLRFGVAEWAEVFVDLPSWAHVEINDDEFDDDGVTDALVGFKARLWDQHGARPAVALIGELGLPTGDSGFTSGSVSPRMVVAASWDLGGGFALFANQTVGFPTDGDERWLEAASAIALGIPVTEGVSAFAEYYALYGTSGRGGPEHYADAGFSFLLTPRLQLDLSAGLGLNERAADLYVAAGVSVLF